MRRRREYRGSARMGRERTMRVSKPPLTPPPSPLARAADGGTSLIAVVPMTWRSYCGLEL